MRELESPLADVHAAIFAGPSIDRTEPHSMQRADVVRRERMVRRVPSNCGLLHQFQSLRLGLVHVTYARDAQQIAQDSAPRSGLIFSLRACGGVLARSTHAGTTHRRAAPWSNSPPRKTTAAWSSHCIGRSNVSPSRNSFGRGSADASRALTVPCDGLPRPFWKGHDRRGRTRG